MILYPGVQAVCLSAVKNAIFVVISTILCALIYKRKLVSCVVSAERSTACARHYTSDKASMGPVTISHVCLCTHACVCCRPVSAK